MAEEKEAGGRYLSLVEAIRRIEAEGNISEIYAHLSVQFHPLLEAAERVYVRRGLMGTDDQRELYSAIQALGRQLNALREKKSLDNRATFTKGPWTADLTDNIYEEGQPVWGVDGPDYSICMVDGPDDAPNEANAHHIAALPEFYAACVKLLNSEISDAMELARAAIMKATRGISASTK